MQSCEDGKLMIPYAMKEEEQGDVEEEDEDEEEEDDEAEEEDGEEEGGVESGGTSALDSAYERDEQSFVYIRWN